MKKTTTKQDDPSDLATIGAARVEERRLGDMKLAIDWTPAASALRERDAATAASAAAVQLVRELDAELATMRTAQEEAKRAFDASGSREDLARADDAAGETRRQESMLGRARAKAEGCIDVGEAASAKLRAEIDRRILAALVDRRDGYGAAARAAAAQKVLRAVEAVEAAVAEAEEFDDAGARADEAAAAIARDVGVVLARATPMRAKALASRLASTWIRVPWGEMSTVLFVDHLQGDEDESVRLTFHGSEYIAADVTSRNAGNAQAAARAADLKKKREAYAAKLFEDRERAKLRHLENAEIVVRAARAAAADPLIDRSVRAQQPLDHRAIDKVAGPAEAEARALWRKMAPHGSTKYPPELCDASVHEGDRLQPDDPPHVSIWGGPPIGNNGHPLELRWGWPPDPRRVATVDRVEDERRPS